MNRPKATHTEKDSANPARITPTSVQHTDSARFAKAIANHRGSHGIRLR